MSTGRTATDLGLDPLAAIAVARVLPVAVVDDAERARSLAELLADGGLPLVARGGPTRARPPGTTGPSSSRPATATCRCSTVGSGDAFAAGLLDALLADGEPQHAIDAGAAAAVLATTTPGDTLIANRSEVEALASGEAPELRR